MPSNPFRATITGVTSTSSDYSAVFYPDYAVRPFAIGIGCVVNSTAIVYTVQHSFDDITSSTWTSSGGNWFDNSGLTGATSNDDSNYAYPVTAIRIVSTAGSSTGTVEMTCIQAG